MAPRTPPTRDVPWRGTARDIRPMLAELADPLLHDQILRRPDLVFEPKYDGIRAVIAIDPEPSVRIYSRLGNDKTEQFPEIVEPLLKVGRRLRAPVVVDGELVAVDDDGQALGFQHLQGRLHVRGLKTHGASRAVSVAFIAFDLLREGDADLRPRPFSERRHRLSAFFRRPGSKRLRLIQSTLGGGMRLRATARRRGWEGVVAKEPSSRYISGKRQATWQKLKFVKTEEFVVGGWTEPRQSRTHFDALLLGYYLDEPSKTDRLIFTGQVGSGFSQAELDRVAGQLAPLITQESPFDDFPRKGKGDHWVEPRLIAQTKFTEWTLDGLLRNPVYLGLRTDKRPRDIRHADQRPVKQASPRSDRVHRATSRARRPASRPRTVKAPMPRHPDPLASQLLETLADLEARKRRSAIELSDGSRVPVGNLEKIFWPDLGITKGELVRYYLRMAPYAIPVVEDRPLVMKRFPNGVDGKSFYQHRAPDPLPDGLRVAVVREKPDHPDSGVPYLIGGRLQTLLYMAQLAVISQDPWFSHLPAIEEVDQVALDLDPMPGATFEQVLDVACWLHDELDRLGIPCFPKTSGSEGIHIFVPLPPGTPYEAGTIFCQVIATVVAARHPDTATVERMVKKRREGTIYIDYLQNIYGKTLAAAYSARASPFAGVSTPLTWTEVHEGVKSSLSPQDFTMRSIFSRLEQVGDLWSQLRASKPARLEAVFDYEQ